MKQSVPKHNVITQPRKSTHWVVIKVIEKLQFLSAFLSEFAGDCTDGEKQSVNIHIVPVGARIKQSK